MATGNSRMILIEGSSWSRGLGNTLKGELKRWFAGKFWWRQIVIWAAAINLIYLIVVLSTPTEKLELDTTLMLFNIFMGIVGPIGVSIIMQGAVVGEKRTGTAAWVLSKPVSRTAFILSKLIANTTGIALKLVIAQGLIAYLITLFAMKIALPLPGFLAALCIHLANILFYLTLTLLMGVLFDQTAPVIGIPLAILFVQNFIMSFYPPLAAFLPWTLAMPVGKGDLYPSLSMNLMTGTSIPSYLPLYITLLMSALFVVIALRVFRKQEL